MNKKNQSLPDPKTQKLPRGKNVKKNEEKLLHYLKRAGPVTVPPEKRGQLTDKP